MNPLLLELPMPILTPRLQIRPRQIGEGAVLAKAIAESLESLKPWMPFAQEAPTAEKMEEHCRKSLADFIARTNFTLSIYDREGKVFVGSTGFHRPRWDVPAFEIGYWVHRDFEGQGMISEAANAVARYCFGHLRARRVEIRCDAENLRSLAVMKRLGFAQEALLRNEAVAMDGSLRDTIICARTDAEGLPALEVSW